MSSRPLRSDLATRLIAVVASLAHAVDRVVRWPLRRIGLGFVPGALLAGALLLVLAVTTALANLEAYETRPAPHETTLGAVNQGTVSSGLWVEFDALLVDEPHRALLPIFDNGVQVDEVVRHYYVARNPREPAEVIVLRSALDPDQAVVRTVSATVERDEPVDAAGLEDGGPGVVLDTSLVLVETGDPFAALDAAEAAAADAARDEATVELLVPSTVAEAADAAQVTVRGRIVAHASAGEDHLYLFGDPDGTGAVILRSPHPPDALPVRIDGTLVIDAFNLQNVLAEWRPEERYGRLEISDRRLLALGVAPQFLEPPWWPVLVPALAGVLLVGGALVPYPVFRPAPAPTGTTGAAAAARARGEIPVRIDGRLPVPHGTALVEDVAGRIEWLPVEEVARIRWRYWGAQLGDFRRDVEEAVRAAGAGAEQLVVHSPVGSMLWPVPADGRLAAEPGLVYRWLRAFPALRLRGEGVEVHLAFGDVEQRDRALAAVRIAG